jgi:hypothetical protein
MIMTLLQTSSSESQMVINLDGRASRDAVPHNLVAEFGGQLVLNATLGEKPVCDDDASFEGAVGGKAI